MSKSHKKAFIVLILINIFLIIAVSIMAVFTFSNNNQSKHQVNLNFNKEAYYSDLQKYVSFIKSKTNFVPEVSITLGSGLDGFADQIEKVAEVRFDEIENFPKTTNPAHEGVFIFGKISDVNVVVMKGRLHNYEGYNPWDVILPIRVCHELGAKAAIITNSVGALNTNFKVGDIAVANSAITQFVKQGLVGPNIDELGDRFPDAYEMYDKNMITVAHNAANKYGLTMHNSVYLQVYGPHFETKADSEIMLKLGADTVGMSSTNEVIAATHMGMKVCNINCISAHSILDKDKPISDDDVLKTGEMLTEQLRKIIPDMLENYSA